MKKTGSIGIILVVLFFVPFIAVKLTHTHDVMALCLMLFFVVNPIFSMIAGIYSGLEIKRMWYIPLVIAVVFLLSAWIVFEMGETDFMIYAGAYCIISTISMLITYAIKSYKEQKNKGADC